MKRRNGGAGTLLLCLILAAILVLFLVNQFYFADKQDSSEVEVIDGVEVERNINSVDRAKQVLQKTKDTLSGHEKAMDKRIRDNLPK